MNASRRPVARPATPWVRTSEPLLWLGGCGHQVQTSARDYYYDAARRDDSPHWVLQLTLAGAGFYRAGRNTTLLTVGRAFFAPIPGPFEYGYPPGRREPYDLVWVSLRGPEAERWARHVVESFGHVLSFGPHNDIAPLMLALDRQQRDGLLGDRYLASAHAYHLLMTVLSRLNRSRVQTTPLVAQALDLIARHGPEPGFNVEQLAARLGCTREHLARQFRTATGVSPLDYLTQHRLRQAAGALRAGSDKLERVAQAAGFSGANYLCRIFRRHVGVTPAEFRAKPWLAGP